MVSLLILASLRISAKCLRIDKNPDCPETGSTAYYQDEGSGRQYIIVTGCDGKTCRKPFTGPIQPQRVVALPVTVPANWGSLTARSLAITEPGADIPLYFIDANGVETHFRNPVDSAVDAYYAMLYLTHEQGGLAKAAPPASEPPAYAPRIDPKELLPDDPDW